MEEKKNKLGVVTVLSENREKEELEIVSAFQGPGGEEVRQGRD